MQLCWPHVQDDSASQCPRRPASLPEGPRGNGGHVAVRLPLAEIKEIAERPTLAEFRELLHQRKPVRADIDAALILREERDAR